MLYWNLNVSYGLLQTWDRNNFGLRKKMMYPQWMYYMLLATSWSRAFSLIYTELKWLNAFSQLNRIAVQKSVLRMAKNYFAI